MSAERHLNPLQKQRAITAHQLPMFMSTADIKANVIPGDFPGDEQPGEGHGLSWAGKLAASKRAPEGTFYNGDNKPHGSGVYEATKKNEISKPVHIREDPRPGRGDDRPRLSNGHHRVAAADDLAQKSGTERYVAVEHSMGEYEHYVPDGLQHRPNRPLPAPEVNRRTDMLNGALRAEGYPSMKHTDWSLQAHVQDPTLSSENLLP